LTGGVSTIVLASSNRGKLAEMRSILLPAGLDLRPGHEFGLREVAEPAPTFVENALIKARHAALSTGLPALADDSGLCVAALDGAPGARSARYAGEDSDDEANNAKLLAALAGVPDDQRQARFQCVIVLLSHHADPMPVICQGVWEGWIQTTASGDNGFGYDPLFHVPTQGCSAAELDSETKNRLSHRGQALAALKRRLATPRGA